MTKHDIKIIKSAITKDKPGLSPAQKRFNRLIKKINDNKQLLTAWRQALFQHQQDTASLLDPLSNTFNEYKVEMITLLDAAHGNKKFTRLQKEKIAYIVADMCHDLIVQHGRNEFKPLYNKYNETDFDTEIAEEQELAKSMFKSQYGIQLGTDDIDFADPLRTAARLLEQMHKQQQQAEAKRKQHKKTAKQLEQEAKRQEEEANVSKSIQAVYRQLVAALHPDREPDATEHKRKTELMQKVTVAYGNKDLLQLLELQLAVEQIDQTKINNISADRLKHYNRVLQKQLDELQAELMTVELRVRHDANIPQFIKITPMVLPEFLQQRIGAIKAGILHITQDLQLFKDDIKQLKLWLNSFDISDEYMPDDICGLF